MSNLDAPPDPLDRLVAAVQHSSKYRHVCEELIRRIGADELSKRRNLKAAIKATRSKLHQTGGAYLEGSATYTRDLETLTRAAASDDLDVLKTACRAIMRGHASTRERLPILDEFFSTTLAGVAPVRSVLDLACGLNPLAIPWMPLAPDATYYAYDMYHDMIAFINGFLALTGLSGGAYARDISQFILPEKVDVALILKSIPCLEQIDKTAGQRMLAAVNADHILVSFPVRSLGGQHKGMAATYTARLHDLLFGTGWPFTRFEFETELAFLITKHTAAASFAERPDHAF